MPWLPLSVGHGLWCSSPRDDSAAILREHVGLNGFDVEVVEAAVLDSEGETSFFVNEATMSASISRRAVDELTPQKFAQTARELVVPTVTLDSYGIPDLVKIDVEGAELKVLRGAEKMLRSDARVLLEIHPLNLAAVGSSEDELLALIAEHHRQPEPIDARNPEGIYHAWLVKGDDERAAGTPDEVQSPPPTAAES